MTELHNMYNICQYGNTKYVAIRGCIELYIPVDMFMLY